MKKLVKVRMCGKTDVGCVRSNNEDNFLIADLLSGYAPLATEELTRSIEENRILLAVADGMGGAAAGEVASLLAVDALRKEFLHFKGEGTPTRLINTIERINTLILDMARHNKEYTGMATTLTAVLVEADKAYIAEVGDSRAYIMRGGRVKQVTTDQSWTELMVEQGLLSREAAQTSNNRNLILQSLGGQPGVKVALTAVELAPGDALLLCSDGLSDKLSAAEMLKFIDTNSSLEVACEQMVRVAKERGGEDNITVVAAKFKGEGLKASPLPERLLSHIEVISVFDHVVETGVRDTRKFSSELRGHNDFPHTINIDNLPHKGQYAAQAQLRVRAEGLVEQTNTLQTTLEQQLQDMDRFAEWLLAQGQLDMPFQQALEELKVSSKSLNQLRMAIEECNKHLYACLKK